MDRLRIGLSVPALFTNLDAYSKTGGFMSTLALLSFVFFAPMAAPPRSSEGIGGMGSICPGTLWQ